MKRLFYAFLLTATWEGVLYITLAGYNLRPYMVFLVLLTLVLIYRKRFRLDSASLCLIVYAASGIPSLINSRSIKDTLITIFFQGVMVVVALSVRTYLYDQTKLESALNMWLISVANIVNAFGWMQVISWIMGVPISPQFNPGLYRVYRPYSFFIEPNFYGNFLASEIAMLSVMWISPASKSLKRKFFLTILFALPLFVLNQSRGPWLGFLFAIMVFVFWEYVLRGKLPKKFIIASIVLPLGLAAVFLLICAIQPDIAEAFQKRIHETINPLNEGAANDRMVEMETSLHLSKNHLIVGHGVGTWGLYLTTQEAARTVGRGVRTPPRNIFVAWLFEGGIIRVLAGIAFLKLLFYRVSRTLRTSDVTRKFLAWSCFVGWLAVFVTFQFTVLEISPLYWIEVGLLLSATDIRKITSIQCQELELT